MTTLPEKIKIDYTTEPAVHTCDACGCQPFTGIQSPQDELATFYRTDEDLILCEECSQPGPVGPFAEVE